jgi:hypothetical protein
MAGHVSEHNTLSKGFAINMSTFFTACKTHHIVDGEDLDGTAATWHARICITMSICPKFAAWMNGK